MSTDVYALAEIPAEVVSDELNAQRVIHIAAGKSLSACITDMGRLYHWGMSIFIEPEYVHGMPTDVVDVACGDNYWIALDKQGNVYTYGNGKAGVLGIAGAKQHAEATVLKSLVDKKVVSISAGWKHAAVVVEE
jgi:E3 ubiquitin-protein ligase HERC2